MSDIDAVAVDSLKALDPEWPIREADIGLQGNIGRYGPIAEIATGGEAINNAAQRLIYVNVRRERSISL